MTSVGAKPTAASNQIKSKMNTHITILEAVAVSALSLFGYVFFKTLFEYLKSK
jgi:hypothetical protein